MSESSSKRRKTKMSSSMKTPEARENFLINLAMDLAEKKLRDGTASSQVLTHFLTLATMKEQLQNEKLRSDLEVARAKIKQIEMQEDIKVLYENAMTAFKSYGGYQDDEIEEDEEEYDEDYY